MSRLLFLAAGQDYAYTDLNGRSILDSVPGPVTVLANAAISNCFKETAYEVLTVRWHDTDSVEKLVRELHAKQSFTAIATIDERLMEFAGHLRSVFDLPGLRTEQVPRYRDKIAMKEALKGRGVKVPNFARCTERHAVETLLERHRHIVLKPIDGVGSADVTFVRTHNELRSWYEEKATKLAEFEAEEFVQGEMYQVDATVCDGSVIYTSVAHYLPGLGCIDFSTGAPLARMILGTSALRDLLEDYSKSVISALELQNGVTHLECFVTPEGEAVFCEIAARPAGGGALQMHEAHSGVNFGRTAVMLSIGATADDVMPKKITPDSIGMIAFRTANPAEIVRIASAKSFNEPWIKYQRIEFEQGDLISCAAHCSDYIAFFVFSGRNIEEFNENLSLLRSRFDSELELAPL